VIRLLGKALPGKKPGPALHTGPPAPTGQQPACSGWWGSSLALVAPGWGPRHAPGSGL